MSYHQAITADTSDECLYDLVQDSIGDRWHSLTDLEQTQLVCEAHDYRQGLQDRVAISDLLAAQPRFPQPVNRYSPSPSCSSPHLDAAPLPVNPQPAVQPTMPYPEPRPSAPILLDDMPFSPSFVRACTMAEYSRELFSHAVRFGHDTANLGPAIPLELPYSMIEDAGHIAELAAKAYRNRRYLPWCMSEYADSLGKYTEQDHTKETQLDTLFPPGEDLESDVNCFNAPCTIIDAEGNILAWYLPDVISRDAHTEWQDSNETLNRVISEEPRNNRIRQPGPSCSWRRDPNYFTPGKNLSPGVTDIASCWFQAGHSGGNNLPEVSSALKNSTLSSASWLKANTRLQAIIGSVLAVTHPGQYKAGLDMLKAIIATPTLLREPEEIAKVVDCWYTPFSGVSLICNTETPRHQDSQGRAEWYNVLSAMGTHSSIGFHLPCLQTTFAYSPRTVVALCGHILSHSVDSSDQGDLAYFAWFMREDVRAYLDVVPGGPSTLEEVLL